MVAVQITRVLLEVTQVAQMGVPSTGEAGMPLHGMVGVGSINRGEATTRKEGGHPLTDTASNAGGPSHLPMPRLVCSLCRCGQHFHHSRADKLWARHHTIWYSRSYPFHSLHSRDRLVPLAAEVMARLTTVLAQWRPMPPARWAVLRVDLGQAQQHLQAQGQLCKVQAEERAGHHPGHQPSTVPQPEARQSGEAPR